MTPRFALSITHAPWAPGRPEALSRLLSELGAVPEHYYLCTEREPNAAWSERIWRWGAERPDDVTHVVFLQDDVRVVGEGRFWPALSALVSEFPADIIGLETIHPMASTFALRGARGYRVRDCIVGVGYVWPRRLLGELLDFRATRLRPGALDERDDDGQALVSEDVLMALFAHATGRRIVSPLPTLVDHDTRVPSTYGHDHYGLRRPHPTWEDWPSADLGCWRGAIAPPEAGWQFGTFAPAMCARFVLSPELRPRLGATPPHRDDQMAAVAAEAR